MRSEGAALPFLPSDIAEVNMWYWPSSPATAFPPQDVRFSEANAG